MQRDFQTWWNDRYFYTNHPLYTAFKKLHQLGADIDYIDFLCDMLRGGDYFRFFPSKPKAARRAKLLEAYLKTQGDQFKLLLNFIATIVIGFTALEIAKKHLPGEDPVSLLSDKEVKAIVSLSFSFCKVWLLDNALANAEASLTQHQEKLERFVKEYGHIPIFRLFLTHNKPILPKRGNKADPWGTLFLVAVTEHLREETGKPHYSEAVRLIEKTRAEYQNNFHGRSGHFPKTNAQSALVRVQNFKKANPSWQESLGLFKDQFRLSALSQKQARG
jgi:hypothetical protein